MEKHNEKWFSNQLDDVFKHKKIPLTPLERSTLRALGSYANKQGKCDPSLDQIAFYVGIDKTNVPRYLKKLKDMKIITVKKQFTRGTKCMKNSQYIINISALVELSANEKGEIEIKGSSPIDVTISPNTSQKQSKGHVNRTVGSRHMDGVKLISNPKATQEPKDIVQTNGFGEVLVIPDDSFFEDFWATYPRKEKKKESHRIWVRDKLDRIADVIIEDVRLRQIKHDRWADRRYIPMPSTYLNNEGWTDEITERTYDAHNGASKQNETAARIIEFTNDYAESRKRNGL